MAKRDSMGKRLARTAGFFLILLAAYALTLLAAWLIA